MDRVAVCDITVVSHSLLLTIYSSHGYHCHSIIVASESENDSENVAAAESECWRIARNREKSSR